MAGSDGWGVSGWGGVLTAGGGSGGGTGATVSNYQPAAGSTITPGTPVSFDVTGDAVLKSLVVSVRYPATGAVEIAYNHDGFSTNYASQGGFIGSERQPISGGYHFILRRRGGWYSSPVVTVEGSDANGNLISQ